MKYNNKKLTLLEFVGSSFFSVFFLFCRLKKNHYNFALLYVKKKYKNKFDKVNNTDNSIIKSISKEQC